MSVARLPQHCRDLLFMSALPALAAKPARAAISGPSEVLSESPDNAATRQR